MEDNEEYVKLQINKYYEFWFGINSFYYKWARVHGITDYTIFTLQVIEQYKDECTLKLICDKLILAKQTVASILDSLEKKNYIYKKINLKDKRNKFIAFTEEGEAYAKPILKALEKTEIDMFKSLSKEKLDNLININKELLNFMDNYFE